MDWKMPRRLATWLLALTGLAVGVHAVHAIAGPDHGRLDAFFDDWFTLIPQAAAAGLCFARAATERRARGAWTAFGVGLVLWSLGDLAWSLWLANLDEPPYPSVADGLYLAAYVALYVGIMLLLRERLHAITRHAWLDGLIGACSVAALAAAFVFPTVIGATEGSPAAIATTLAYPALDVVMLSFVILAMLLRRGRREPIWILLAAGLVLMALADSLASYQQALGTYREGTLLDTAWPAAMLLIAIAAWRPHRAISGWATGGVALWLPGIFCLPALLLLLDAGVEHVAPAAVALAGATLGLAVLRGGLLFLENGELLRQAQWESVTDNLTGLPNRRRLLGDLERAFQPGDDGVRRDFTLVLYDLDGFKGYNDTFGHGAGDDLLRRLGGQLADALGSRGRAYRLGGDEFCALVDGEHDEDSALLATLVDALSASGEGFCVTTSAGAALLPREVATPREALLTADQRMYAQKARRAGARGQARDVLVQVLVEREPELHRHMSDVAVLSHAVAMRLELSTEDVDVTVRAAELHDVGKVAIPDAILHKHGPLSADEWRFMRRHTVIGERIISAATALRPVARVVRSSHERWDGTGYPDALAGEDIPLGARIVFACDAYDAMTSAREYRAAMTHDQALAQLRAGAGTQFDPAVVDALFAVLAAGPLAVDAAAAAS